MFRIRPSRCALILLLLVPIVLFYTLLGRISSSLHANTASASVATTTPPTNPPLKIGIITLNLYDQPFPDWIEKATLSKQEYCYKHNYTCLVFTQRIIPKEDTHLMKVWDKIYLAKQILPEYDWIWLLDTDSYLTNANLTLETVISRSRSLHRSDHPMEIIISHDENALNCGSFFLHNSPWTHQTLNHWWDLRNQKHYPHWDAWFEQAAFLWMHEKNEFGVKERTSVVPQHWINSYMPYRPKGAYEVLKETGKYHGREAKEWWWRPGDLVMHGPGFYKGTFERFVGEPFGL
ncbi:hypothetical protein HK097_010360 [Rhizophlyctis rosea]|uniref:Glycosyltransferase family 34 protein n=1 Tax=Rhizophlyctis rosea TaxID=64517 RepID=A0AAD5X0I5_9FUNG|nr:hypothetical protein HK097_010360 [Rhizophlyctis rosea]